MPDEPIERELERIAAEVPESEWTKVPYSDGTMPARLTQAEMRTWVVIERPNLHCRCPVCGKKHRRSVWPDGLDYYSADIWPESDKEQCRYWKRGRVYVVYCVRCERDAVERWESGEKYDYQKEPKLKRFRDEPW